MLKQHCACGQKYSLPDSAAGKKAKCKKCGAVFVVASAVAESPSIADDIGLFDEIAEVAEHAKSARRAAVRAAEAAAAKSSEYDRDADEPSTAIAPPIAISPTKQGYFQSLLWTFLFPTSPNNLMSFVAMWVILVVGSFVPCFLVTLLLVGWYSAFRFAVVESGAAGEDDLPSVIISGGIYEELVYPAFKWIACCIVAFLPAGIYLAIAVIQGRADPADFLRHAAAGFSGLADMGGDMLIFTILLFAGLFLWPMIVLCVALGGFETLYRVDLIVRTIIRTFPVYLLTVGIVFGAELLEGALTDLMASKLGARAGFPPSIGSMLGAAALWVVVATGLSLYFEIVAMRAIGLYYHHFKRRFAWSWG